MVTDYELVVDDLHSVVMRAKGRYPGRQLVLVGHSMGGMIGARYAQLHQEELSETRRGIEALGFTRLEEVVYPEARHEVFNETNKDEVLTRTADFIDRVAG